MQFKQRNCIRQSDLEERREKCYQNVQPLFQGKKTINRICMCMYVIFDLLDLEDNKDA